MRHPPTISRHEHSGPNGQMRCFAAALRPGGGRRSHPASGPPPRPRPVRSPPTTHIPWRPHSICGGSGRPMYDTVRYATGRRVQHLAGWPPWAKGRGPGTVGRGLNCPEPGHQAGPAHSPSDHEARAKARKDAHPPARPNAQSELGWTPSARPLERPARRAPHTTPHAPHGCPAQVCTPRPAAVSAPAPRTSAPQRRCARSPPSWSDKRDFAPAPPAATHRPRHNRAPGPLGRPPPPTRHPAVRCTWYTILHLQP